MKNKKTVTKSSKTRSKVVANSKQKGWFGSRALWQRLAIVLVLFISVSAAGGYGYYRWTENDLKAKAAAFQYPSSGISGDKRYGFAICYQKEYLASGFPVKKIVGVVTRPKGSFFWDGTTISALTSYKLYYDSQTNHNWFRYSSYDMTFVSAEVPIDGWVKLRSYAAENLGEKNKNRNVEASTTLTAVPFIPRC